MTDTRGLINVTIAYNEPFYVELTTTLGTIGFQGRNLAEPIPHFLTFETWEGPYGWRHRAVEESAIARFVSALEDCPECLERPGNLDNLGEFDDPLCNVCARVAWEERNAESLIADGGI